MLLCWVEPQGCDEQRNWSTRQQQPLADRINPPTAGWLAPLLPPAASTLTTFSLTANSARIRGDMVGELWANVSGGCCGRLRQQAGATTGQSSSLLRVFLCKANPAVASFVCHSNVDPLPLPDLSTPAHVQWRATCRC